ncbi:hypothetical protein, partial [Streptomyces sp. NPDC001268]
LIPALSLLAVALLLLTALLVLVLGLLLTAVIGRGRAGVGLGPLVAARIRVGRVSGRSRYQKLAGDSDHTGD